MNNLDADQLDILMKYIYSGLSSGEYGKELLNWHAIVLAKAGHGSIVRTIADKVNTL